MATIRSRSRADGTTGYQVMWRDPDLPRTPSGGLAQTSLTFDDKEEAKLLVKFLEANGHRLKLAEQAALEFRSKAPTLNDLIGYHFSTLTGVEKGTLDDYKRLMKRHVADSIGLKPLDTLTRADIVTWLQGKDLSPKSLKNIHSVVSSALTTGVNDKDWDISTNPAKGVKMPKGGGQKKERPLFMSRPQVDALIGSVREVYDRIEDPEIAFDPGLYVDFQSESGMRPAESTAVRAHVDTTIKPSGRIVIHVSNAWKARETGLTAEELGDPKTLSGHRDVALSMAFSKKLRPYLESVAAGEFLWGTKRGTRLLQQTWYETYWHPARMALVYKGVLPRRPRFYDLRHTHISWLIEMQVPILVIAKRVGHKSAAYTMEFYGHLAQGADERAADALDGHYEPVPLVGGPDVVPWGGTEPASDVDEEAMEDEWEEGVA